MKTTRAAIFPFPVHESWYTNQSKLKQIFTRLTGYDIMFEESRLDLTPVKSRKKEMSGK